MPEIHLLDNGGKIELVPARLILVAVFVLRLEAAPTVEIEFPEVLSELETVYSTPGTVADVVIDLALVDQRAGPQVLGP